MRSSGTFHPGSEMVPAGDAVSKRWCLGPRIWQKDVDLQLRSSICSRLSYVRAVKRACCAMSMLGYADGHDRVCVRVAVVTVSASTRWMSYRAFCCACGLAVLCNDAATDGPALKELDTTAGWPRTCLVVEACNGAAMEVVLASSYRSLVSLSMVLNFDGVSRRPWRSA